MCASVVGTVGEAVVCRQCKIVAHERCVPAQQPCPLCDAPLESGRALHAATSSAGQSVDPDLAQIHGWLLLFLVTLSINAVTGILIGALQAWAMEDATLRLLGALFIAVSLLGGWSLQRMWARDPAGPTYAQWYMGLSAGLMLMTGITAGDPISGSGRGLVYWAIWGTYLLRSKRVAAVYQKPD